MVYVQDRETGSISGRFCQVYTQTQVTDYEKACRFPKCVESVRVGTAPSIQLEDQNCERRGEV